MESAVGANTPTPHAAHGLLADKRGGPHNLIMGHLSFFQAACVGRGAISRAESTNVGEAMNMMARPQQQQQRRRRPNVNNTSSKSMPFISVVVLLLCTFAAAQDTCNCSPIQYTFVLKLEDHTCPVPPDSVTPDDAFNYFGPGVQQYTCDPQKGHPVNITLAQFIPQDQFSNPIDGQTQVKKNLELTNGESLTFTSPTTDPPIVGAITLKLVGVDEKGGEVQSIWTIQFSNECGVLSLENETKLGWVIFRDLVRPSQELCPRDVPPPYGSYYHKVFSKGSKHTRHSSSKSAKNLKSKYNGYSNGSSKSGKSKSGKFTGGRRILQAAISTDAERTSRPRMTMEEQVVEEGGMSDEGFRLRRRRLHV